MHSAQRGVIFVFVVSNVLGAGASKTILLDIRAGGILRTHHPESMALVPDQAPKTESTPSWRLVGGNSSAVSDGHPAFPLLGLASLGRRAGGLVLMFASMCLSSIGFVMQRKAHLESQDGGWSRCLRNPLWLAGVALYISAALPDVVAYTRIPQMLCCSVGCFRIVMISVLGHFWLGDRLGRREITGIATCAIGALLCVRFGPGSETMPTYPGELHGRKVTYYVYAGLVLLGILLLVVYKSFSEPSSKLLSCALPMTTALSYGLGKVFNSELAYVPIPDHFLYEPLLFKLMGAILFFGLLDLCLNLQAAQRMPVHVYAPLYFAFGVLIQNFQGLVIFDEIKDMEVYHTALTFLGAGLALAGALMIQLPQFEKNEEKEYTEPAGVSHKFLNQGSSQGI